MLTVKLIRGNTTRIVEALSVNIYPVGKPKTTNENAPSPCTNEVREVALESYRGDKQQFYVGFDGALSIYEHVELWDCAYIENAHGATTERVLPG